MLTVLLKAVSIQPPAPFGYLIAATSLILLGMGTYLLMPARSTTVR